VHITDKSTLVLQSHTDALRVEDGLCSETSLQSADDSNAVISTKIEEEEIPIKGEDEPIAISFASAKDEPVVSPQTFHQYIGLLCVIMPFSLPAFPHKSAPYGLYIFREYIKYEG
jgi:hypothetical protein